MVSFDDADPSRERAKVFGHAERTAMGNPCRQLRYEMIYGAKRGLEIPPCPPLSFLYYVPWPIAPALAARMPARLWRPAPADLPPIFAMVGAGRRSGQTRTEPRNPPMPKAARHRDATSFLHEFDAPAGPFADGGAARPPAGWMWRGMTAALVPCAPVTSSVAKTGWQVGKNGVDEFELGSNSRPLSA